MVNTGAGLAYVLDLSKEHFAGYAVLTLEVLSLLRLTLCRQRNFSSEVMHKLIYQSYPLTRKLELYCVRDLSNLDYESPKIGQMSLELMLLHSIGSGKILQLRRLLRLFITSALNISILTSSHLKNTNISDYT